MTRRKVIAPELSTAQAWLLRKNCLDDDSPVGWRDAAIIDLMLRAGLTVHEIVALKVRDTFVNFDVEDLAVIAPKSYCVRKSVSLGTHLHDATPFVGLARWLDAWQGQDPDPLFIRIRKGGELTSPRAAKPTPLSTQGIREILYKRGKACGLPSLTARMLRATYDARTARPLIAKGSDIYKQPRTKSDPNSEEPYD